MKKPVIAPHYRLQFETASKSYVLLYPEGLVELSDSAAEILELCNGQHSTDEIVKLLADKYQEPQVGSDVREFFGVAYEHGWIKDV